MLFASEVSCLCHHQSLLQTSTAALFSSGDVLYIFRPLITSNSEEPWLFGTAREGVHSHACFSYLESCPVAPPLMNDYGYERENPCGVHILLGSVSCVIAVKGKAG